MQTTVDVDAVLDRGGMRGLLVALTVTGVLFVRRHIPERPKRIHVPAKPVDA
jgi:hypothetical protein